MAAPIKLTGLICRYLLKSIRSSSVVQALKRFLQRLALYTSSYKSLWLTSTPVFPPENSTQPQERLISKLDDKGYTKEPRVLDPQLSYTVIHGETITLNDDIMPSICPLSGNGIHNTSRTSMNLEASRSAHSLNISMSRNASRSNLDAGSQRARPFVSSVNSGVEDLDITITVQNPGSTTIPLPSHGDVPLASLHSPYLHPRDTTTRSSSPIELRVIDGSVISPTTNGGDLRSDSATLNVERHGITSSRSSLSLSDNIEAITPVEISYTNANNSGIDISLDNGIERVLIVPPTTQIDRPSFTCLGNYRIVPVMPESIADIRYKGRPTMYKANTTFLLFKLLNRFTDQNSPDPSEYNPSRSSFISCQSPEGWVKYTHPEGVRYFHHPEKGVYSDSNLDDERVYNRVMNDIKTLEEHRSSCGIEYFNSGYKDLVIHASCGNQDQDFEPSIYYYVDHQMRSVFFLDIYDTIALDVNEGIYGPTSPDHLRHEIEAQYWFHVQLYPSSRLLTRESIASLRDVILHFIGDAITSLTSTAPYSIQDLRDILDLTTNMDKNVDMPTRDGAQSLLARQMFIFARSRFIHFHGEPHARLENNVSVYGDNVHQRTWLLNSLSTILFYGPDFHSRNLQNMQGVDRIVHKSVFRESMQKINDEWDHSVLFATVMLNANVAFLAIQSVDNNDSPQRSAAQICSYVSMFASIGSIVLGLHLSRKNKTNDLDNMIYNVNEVQRYMESRSYPRFGGPDALAILYSLPYALLIWGMVSFFLAVALICFIHSDTFTRTIVGFCVASSIILIFWCIQTNWDKGEADSVA
ncbi:hypothetical protein CVT25_000671 [Psilocybe cyanescens]|uniref:WW domain-containing protein n=1 Tax=Psilocybe cyanescens TaxID=93625 RepID=A0A409WZL2_PSICY|nr:hypothetical protein CVT25_000671 [Psilocybe cyanescens]